MSYDSTAPGSSAHSLRTSNVSTGRGTAADIEALLEHGVRDGVFPGAVLVVSRRGEVVFARNVGNLEYEQTLSLEEVPAKSGEEPAPPRKVHPTRLESVYDVDSLTASIGTATVMMRLVQEGKVRLEDRVSRFMQGFGVLGKSPITIAHVLNHTSGLRADANYYQELLKANSGDRIGILGSRAARQFVLNAITRSEVKPSDVGTKQLLSDSNYIVLSHLIEVLTGLTFERAVYRYVTQPLGLKSTSFVDLGLVKRRGLQPVTEIIAPTELCPVRKRVLRGEVHDENAWAMGGISGNAGLFSNALDVNTFATTVLGSLQQSNSYLRRDVIELFFKGPGASQPGSFRFGWDTPSKENGMADAGLSEHAVGVNGNTGCSVWMEPKESVAITFLSNRIHPTRGNKKISGFRPELFRAVLRAL